MTAEKSLRFRAILGPAGIERDRTVDIGPDGRIRDIRSGSGPFDGFLALPGLTNAHSHAFQRALAGFGEAASGEASFWSWRDAMYRLAARVTPERLFDIARRAYSEMLRGGFTRVIEFHYLHHGPDGARGTAMAEAVTDAAGEVGLPITFLPVYYRTSGFDGAPATADQARFSFVSVDEFLSWIETLGSRADGAAPHSLRAVPPAELDTLATGIRDLLGEDAPLHIHVSEQTREVAECEERFGATPIDLLMDTVSVDRRWSLVHATHATPSERERIRTSGATVVLCPLTEAYLGDGVFEAREHSRAGGFAAVGTDANTRLSAADELRCLEYGQRLRDERRARLANERGLGSSLWSWLVEGGARAAGHTDHGLRAGAPADLVVLDPGGPALLGHEPESALDAWLIGGDDRDIAAVYVAGAVKARGGTIPDEDEIADRFAGTLRAIWAD